MKNFMLLFACAVLTLESSQAGLPELEKKIFSTGSFSQTPDQMRSRLDAHFATLETRNLLEALTCCVEESQLDFVGAHIERLHRTDLAQLLYDCLNYDVGKDIVNTHIQRLEGDDLKHFFYRCLKDLKDLKENVGKDIVNAHIEKLEGNKLVWLLLKCLKHDVGKDIVNAHIQKLKGDNLRTFFNGCLHFNIDTDIVNAYIEKHLINLKGKKLAEGLWWCACLRQKNSLQIIQKTKDLLQKIFGNLGDALVTKNLLNTIEKQLKNSKIDISKFFEDIEGLVQRDFKNKQNREDKKLEQPENPIQAMIPEYNEAISLLDDVVLPMHFWALRAHIQYKSEIKKKIDDHLNCIREHIADLFPDSKSQENFLNGIDYVSKYLPDAYHVALLDGLAEKSALSYISTYLQKIFESHRVIKNDNFNDWDQFVEFFFKVFDVDDNKAFTHFNNYVTGIWNSDIGLLRKPDKSSIAFMAKIQKTVKNHWFSKDALEDLSSPTGLMLRFYEDSVTLGSGHSKNEKLYPHARCIYGIMTDSQRILSSLYDKKILDYTGNLRCNNVAER